jgi:hypothetical protein
MNLKTEDLRNIYLRYISTKPGNRDISCPSLQEIVRAIRYPAKKTRKIMNHVSDCPDCLPLFLFLKQIIQAEESFLISLKDIYSSETKRPNRQKILPLRLPLLKFAPYMAIVMFISLLLVTSVKYFNFLKDKAIRSPAPALSLVLVQDEISREPCPYYLRWNPLPEAKSYLIEIFDDSLLCLWHQTSEENTLTFPAYICEKVKSGQRLIVYFEAREEEGKICLSWLGELSSLEIISGQKERKGHLR